MSSKSYGTINIKVRALLSMLILLTLGIFLSLINHNPVNDKKIDSSYYSTKASTQNMVVGVSARSNAMTELSRTKKKINLIILDEFYERFIENQKKHRDTLTSNQLKKAQNYAKNYLLQAKYGKSLTLFRAIHNFYQSKSKLEPDKNKILLAEMLYYIAIINVELGNYNVASNQLKQVLSLQKKYLTADDTHLRNTYFAKAGLLLKMGDVRQAHKIILKTAEHDKKRYGLNHRTTADDFNLLANSLFQLTQYTNAKTFFLQSQTIRKKLFGPNHILLSNNAFGLADIDIELAYYHEALNKHLNILEKRKKRLPSDHPDTIKSLLKTAKLHRIMALYEKTGEYLAQAEKSILTIFSHRHPLYAQLLVQKSLLAIAQEEYFLAEEFEKLALELQIKLYGRNSVNVARTLVIIADHRALKKKYNQAIFLYTEANTIFTLKLGSTNLLTAELMNKTAEALIKMERYSKASKLNTSAKQLIDLIANKNHPLIAYNIINQADILISQNHFAKAEAELIRALNIQKMIYEENHPQIAITKLKIGALLAKQSRVQKTM